MKRLVSGSRLWNSHPGSATSWVTLGRWPSFLGLASIMKVLAFSGVISISDNPGIQDHIDV